MQPGVQIAEVGLQLLPVSLPSHTVDPCGSLRADRPVGPPETIDADMVHQRGEPCFLILLRYLTYTSQRTWRTWSDSVSGARFVGRVLLGQSPSLHHLRHR